VVKYKYVGLLDDTKPYDDTMSEKVNEVNAGEIDNTFALILLSAKKKK